MEKEKNTQQSKKSKKISKGESKMVNYKVEEDYTIIDGEAIYYNDKKIEPKINVIK